MLATFWTWTNVNRNVVVTHINSSSSPCCNVFYDFLHPLQTCTNERLCVFDNFKIFQDAFQDLHWGHAYTVAVSCWVVGKETCAAPAAAHVFGQCWACSCSHHIVSGQPFVPSRLSHLAVHGTIDRTIRRFWVNELWWTMMNSFAQGRDPQQLDCTRWLYLACTSCTKFNRSNQARSESILGSHRTTTWRTYSCCSTCLNTCEGNKKWHSFCWRILLSSLLQSFFIFLYEFLYGLF